MNDRELLELAAKAAGRCIVDWIGDGNWVSVAVFDDGSRWQPLHENQFTDCMGDALRLAVKLRMHINADGMEVGYRIDGVLYVKPVYVVDGSIEESICLAIVRAAAEIGKAMP